MPDAGNRGRLNDWGLPLLNLRIIPSANRLTALIDTGFDGELVVYYDDLRSASIEVVFDRVVQARLADGSQATFLGATLTIDWFGEPRAVNTDVVPAIRPAGAYPLIGCRVLRNARLEIDFLRSTVLLSRAP